jgi:hypothetical protein
LFEPQKAQKSWKKRASVLLEERPLPTLVRASSYAKGLKFLVRRCWTLKSQKRPDFGKIIL